jgi:hypothetical protein
MSSSLLVRIRNESTGIEQTYCFYCYFKQWIEHPLFCYLLSDKRCTTTDSELIQSAQYVGLATLPCERLNEQNRIEGYHTGAKSTNAIAPYWQDEIIIGPFYRRGDQFKQLWRQTARGMQSRFKRGPEQMHQWNNKPTTVQDDPIQWNYPRRSNVDPRIAEVAINNIINNLSNNNQIIDYYRILLSMIQSPGVKLNAYYRDPEFMHRITDQPSGPLAAAEIGGSGYVATESKCDTASEAPTAETTGTGTDTGTDTELESDIGIDSLNGAEISMLAEPPASAASAAAP